MAFSRPILATDSLRAAVQEADRYEPEPDREVRAFCRHYGTVMLPVRPYKQRLLSELPRFVQGSEDHGADQ